MLRYVPPAELDSAAWALPASPTRSRSHGGISATIGAVASVALLIAAWWFLAPPQLGGSTSFVTIDGTSMLPSLARSDLAVLRPAGEYRVGDVVGYHSRLLGRVVLHRIVSRRNGHYLFKGDNNSFVDPDHPSRAQLVGKLWFRVPAAGRIVAALHVPLIAALVAGLLVLALGLGGKPPADRRSSS